MEGKKNTVKVMGISPWQQIKKRFRKNKLALAGLYFIIISFLLAVFAFVIIPDKTPMANRMNLSISNQPPGFNIVMLKVPKSYVEKANFLQQLFEGRNDAFNYIALSTFHLSDSTIYYREFTGENNILSSPENKIPLSGLGNNTTQNSYQIIDESIVQKTFYFGTDRYASYQRYNYRYQANA